MSQSIEEVLEQCRQRLARGETIDSCLAAYPTHAAELTRLLPIVTRAQALATDPNPAFSARARQRFASRVATARADRQRAAWSRGPLGFLQNLLVPLAVVLVLLLSGFGLVEASQNTLPDSPLYTVKQAQENVAQVFTRGADGKAAYHLRTANRRLQELQTAEQLRKGPAVLLTLAVGMVQASNAATVQIAQTSGPSHDQLVASARPLFDRERRTLERYSRSRVPAVAAEANRLIGQLNADDRSLGR